MTRMSPARGLWRFRASRRSFKRDAPGLTSPTIGSGMIWIFEGGESSFFRPFGAFSLRGSDPRLTPGALFSRRFGAFLFCSTTALLIGGEGEIVQLPLPDQALSVGFAGSCGERKQVREIVNVERDAG